MNISFTNKPVTPVKLGSISGTKFNDSDGDGIKDANESGLANWLITLRNGSTGAAIFNTTTANDGSYKFSNLTARKYTVGEVLKSGWMQTAPKPVPPGTYMVTITSAGEDVTGKDFGNKLITIPSQQIQQITTKVQGLVTSGVLNQGQGNSLIAKLDAATKNLNKGNTKAAINELKAFINEVQGDIRAGKLTPAQGQALIDAANAIINQIK